MASIPQQTQISERARFFLALLPPPAIQAYATELKTYFQDHYHSKAALKSPPHITLQPPFEWPRQDYNRLRSALSVFAARQASFPVSLSGFGAFPPRVIYLAVDHTPELMTLQAALGSHLAETLGIADPRSQTRSYSPHLTVAFRDLKPALFRRAWPEFEHRDAQFAFTAEAITLLIHTGQRWVVDTDLPLEINLQASPR